MTPPWGRDVSRPGKARSCPRTPKRSGGVDSERDRNRANRSFAFLVKPAADWRLRTGAGLAILAWKD